MRNFKLTIEYDGTHFKGWQIQKKGERTVQNEITKILNLLCKEKITLIGSGRTDTGVHALGQVAHFKTTSKRSIDEFKAALNAHLPKDIVIHHVQSVAQDFHAQYNVTSKIYRYTINTKPTPSALNRHQQLFHPHHLDIDLIKKEIKDLLGKKDFKAFQGSNPDTKKGMDTVRTILNVKASPSKGLLILEFEADGFLYKMVRNMVGTLLAIGNGKLPPGSIKKILASKDRTFAGPTAKPQGLCLHKVNY